MKRLIQASLALALAACHSDKAATTPPTTTAAPAASASVASASIATAPIYAFQEKTIDGDTVRLDKYAGKVLLIVNVASKCGFTPQYEGLEKLYDKHQAEGLEVLGFPSDQFGHQEPGSEGEIKTFCMTKYAVKFPLFAKIDVNGPNANPLYQFLRKQQPGNFSKDTPGAEKLYAHLEKSSPDVIGTDAIKWNFTKFLVDRQGNVIKRFESSETPESIEPAVVAELAKK